MIKFRFIQATFRNEVLSHTDSQAPTAAGAMEILPLRGKASTAKKLLKVVFHTVSSPLGFVFAELRPSQLNIVRLWAK